MASRIGPRSVKDATRFTSTIPHATSKSATSAAPKASRIPGETPEQRVRRLRQAHLAAQKAQVSKADRVIDASRRLFDVAHRWTVGGLVMFTGTSTRERRRREKKKMINKKREINHSPLKYKLTSEL